MFRNKRAYGTMWSWIYGLIMLFALGLGYIMMNQVLQNHVDPIMTNIVNQSVDEGYINATQAATMITQGNQVLNYWKLFPIVIVLVIITFWLAQTIYNKRDLNA